MLYWVAGATALLVPMAYAIRNRRKNGRENVRTPPEVTPGAFFRTTSDLLAVA